MTSASAAMTTPAAATYPPVNYGPGGSDNKNTVSSVASAMRYESVLVVPRPVSSALASSVTVVPRPAPTSTKPSVAVQSGNSGAANKPAVALFAGALVLAALI
jgi:hypothetical protein